MCCAILTQKTLRRWVFFIHKLITPTNHSQIESQNTHDNFLMVNGSDRWEWRWQKVEMRATSLVRICIIITSERCHSIDAGGVCGWEMEWVVGIAEYFSLCYTKCWSFSAPEAPQACIICIICIIYSRCINIYRQQEFHLHNKLLIAQKLSRITTTKKKLR